MLDIINLSCSYGKDEVFKNLTIKNIKEGLTFITGRSGCGKSSLVKQLLGIIPIGEGEIRFKGAKINDFSKFRRDYVSFVFQDNKLVDYYTIKENLLMITQDTEKINEVLNYVHLTDKINDYPSHLSGGERQRINICRAFLKDSYINIFDEPTSSVNKELKVEIMMLIKDLFKNKIVIIISHNNDLVNKFADRVINIEKREDIIINNKPSSNSFITNIKPPLFYLTIKSYLKRNKMPFIVVAIVFIVVIITIALFAGINNYIIYNIERKPDYNYFYINNSEEIIQDLSSKYDIEIINNYKEIINEKYRQKITKIDSKTIDDFFEIKIYSNLKTISINKGFYNLIDENKIKINEKIFETNIIDDGKIYTPPTIYFDYDYLYNLFGDIETKEACIRTNEYEEVYNYLKLHCKNKYSLDLNSDDIIYDNSTIMINESLKPLMDSIHGIILLLSYSILVMAFSFIRTMLSYNLKLRKDELIIYQYYGLKNINIVVIYETFVLIFISLLLAVFISYLIIPHINKLTPMILYEYFELVKLDMNSLIVTTLIGVILMVIIYIEFNINKHKKSKIIN